mmetsp:Transcript_8718/g.13393  ORF Transcript_8718/g.13393 Transcript_8718/m.13393 type:complete len:92 (-) Transcript_8718:99-374(-)
MMEIKKNGFQSQQQTGISSELETPPTQFSKMYTQYQTETSQTKNTRAVLSLNKRAAKPTEFHIQQLSRQHLIIKEDSQRNDGDLVAVKPAI